MKRRATRQSRQSLKHYVQVDCSQPGSETPRYRQRQTKTKAQIQTAYRIFSHVRYPDSIPCRRIIVHLQRPLTIPSDTTSDRTSTAENQAIPAPISNSRSDLTIRKGTNRILQNWILKTLRYCFNLTSHQLLDTNSLSSYRHSLSDLLVKEKRKASHLTITDRLVREQ